MFSLLKGRWVGLGGARSLASNLYQSISQLNIIELLSCASTSSTVVNTACGSSAWS